MDNIILWIMAIAMVLGALDRMFGSRLGLGKQFEEGILAIGAEERFGAGRDEIVEKINRDYGARMIPDDEILSLLDSVGMDARAIPGEPGVLYLAVKRRRSPQPDEPGGRLRRLRGQH